MPFNNEHIEGERANNEELAEIDFPEIIELNDFGGDFNLYQQRLLQVYQRDLWNGRLTFNGLRVVPRVHKKYRVGGLILDHTFAHITTKGDIEDDRVLDIRRCERLVYIKPIIENCLHNDVKIWENSRFDKKGNEIVSVVLWCEKINSKVILTRRRGTRGRDDYYTITSFYLVNQGHKIRQLNKEYEEYVQVNGEFELE